MFFRNDCPKSVLLASLALFLAGCAGDPDADGDGLPDAWESMYDDTGSGNLDPTGDPDSDGFTNAEEYMAGSYPNLAASTPDDIDGDGVANAADTNPRLFDRTLIGANGIDDTASVNAGNAGFTLRGAARENELGVSVSGAGDVNGDGIDDLIIGARGVKNAAANPNVGAAYVIYGTDDGSHVNINVSSLTLADGFRILGVAAENEFGYSVSGAGDVNNDGIDDLIVGARQNDNGGVFAGAAYVIYGQDSTVENYVDRGNIEVADTTGDAPTFPASAGFSILGAEVNNMLGWSVSGAGDVNGDGIADVIVGAIGVDHADGTDSAGAAYVIYGQDSVTRGNINVGDTTSFSASVGFTINGVAVRSGNLGHSVSGAGDVNGDGIADLIVGAIGVDAGGSSAGAAYVIYGTDDEGKTRGNIDVSDTTGDAPTFPASAGFRILGAAAGGWLGSSVSGAGDVNGDGIADLIVGAYRVNSFTGAAYVIYGQDSVTRGNINVGDTTGDAPTFPASAGFRILGAAANDQLGRSVSGAGDVNGDGTDDLIVGAPYNDAGDTNIDDSQTGAAYVIYGQANDAVDASGDTIYRGQINVGSLAAEDGFRLLGAAAPDKLGWSVSGAGDVNGDGFDDLIAGALDVQNAAGDTNFGAAYVLLSPTPVE